MKKVFWTLLTFLFTGFVAFTQSLQFSPSDVKIKGNAYEQKSVEGHGAIIVRRPMGGGLSFYTNYVESGALQTEDVKGLMKKKLFSADQISSLQPVVIDGKFYSVETTKKSIELVERDMKTLDIKDNEKVIYNSSTNLSSFLMADDDGRYFTLWEFNTGSFTGDPYVFRALVFDREDLKSPLEVNINDKEEKRQNVLDYGVTAHGSFYLVSTPIDKKTNNGAQQLSDNIDLEFHTSTGKKAFHYEFNGRGVLAGSELVETEAGVYLKVLSVNGDQGVVLDILKVEDDELIPSDSKEISYEELYQNNGTKVAQNYSDRIKSTKGGDLRFPYRSVLTKNYEIASGVLHVHSMVINDVPVLLNCVVNDDFSIGKVVSQPVNDVVGFTLDDENKLHVFFNDDKSRYNESGAFESFTDASGDEEDLCPVHLEMATDGTDLERNVMKNGFSEGECFDLSFGFQEIREQNILILGKSSCGTVDKLNCDYLVLGTIQF